MTKVKIVRAYCSDYDYTDYDSSKIIIEADGWEEVDEETLKLLKKWIKLQDKHEYKEINDDIFPIYSKFILLVDEGRTVATTTKEYINAIKEAEEIKEKKKAEREAKKAETLRKKKEAEEKKEKKLLKELKKKYG